MDNIYTNLIQRLNYLIGFLDVSSESVYDNIKGHKTLEGFESIGELYENKYEIYRNQITTSSLLLGYIHFEAFLSDLIKKCLLANPRILIPKGKQVNEKNISYLDFLNAESYDKVLENLINKEVRNILYKSMPEILDYLKTKLQLEWDETVNTDIIIANKIRNCCMHNNCKADKSLGIVEGFTEGKQIELNTGDVHSYGLKARKMSLELWSSAQTKFNLN